MMLRRERHPLVVDAHLDLAYNVLSEGRTYQTSAATTRRHEGRRSHACTVGLPDLIYGRVGLVFASIFVEPRKSTLQLGAGNMTYADPAEAHALAVRQLDFYRRWVEHNPAHLRLITTRSELEQHVSAWMTASKRSCAPQQHSVGLVLAMEGAEPIREPKELGWWYERGLRIVGPAWDTTRYAGGTWGGGRFTKLGRELLAVMAEFNMALDVSHLSHESLYEALDVFEGRGVIASHSNAHRYIPTSRHLPDKAIARIAERGGVIGVVLYNQFLRRDWSGRKQDVTLDHVVRMIDHICQVTGSADHVGIGSDYDGGLGWEDIPRELDSVCDHYKIGDALLERGFGKADVDKIMRDNWLRVLRDVLP
ncbi:MAG: dipeptidase [Thermoflexales bacterium]